MSEEAYEYSQDPGRRIREGSSWLAKKPRPNGCYERRYVDRIVGNRVAWFHWTGDRGECQLKTFLRWAGKEVAWYS